MNTAISAEAQELDLLERIFLRLGNAETDQQLEESIGKFLVPILMKLENKYKSVQDKVFELLTHISKQLKSRPQVLLPIDDVLACFQGSNASPQLTNFSLVYIRLGFPRLPIPEQVRLLPALVLSLEGKAKHQQDGILQVLTPALVHLTIPKSEAERSQLFSLADKPAVRASLLEFFLYYLLLPYSPMVTYPGLSSDQVHKVMGTVYPQADMLEKEKCAVLKLLAVEIFCDEEVMCHFLVASGDSRHSVAELGDHRLRLASSGVDWNNPKLVGQLFSLYFGSSSPAAKPVVSSSAQASPTQPPASLAVRLKIMLHLVKSTLATNCFPQCIQAVFDGLFGSSTNTKLQSLSLQLIHAICTRAKEQKLAIMAPVLLTALTKVSDNPTQASQLRQLAYTGIGLLSRRSSDLFHKDLKVATKLFESLEKETVGEVIQALQDCLNMLSRAYQGLQDSGALVMEAMLLEKISSASSHVRCTAACYASVVFPFSHTPSRFISIIAVGDNKEEVREEGRKGLKYPRDDDTMDVSYRAPPTFTSMVHYFHQKCMQRVESGTTYSTVAGTMPLHPLSMAAALRFLRLCLLISAGVTDDQKDTHEGLKLLARHLKGSEMAALFQYVEILKLSLGTIGGTELQSIAMECLREVVIVSPQDVSNELRKDVSWLKGFIYSSSADVREIAAHLLGILSSRYGTEPSLLQAKEFLQDTFSETYSVHHGAVLALGHVAANLLQFHMDSMCLDAIRRALERLVSLLVKGSLLPATLAACVSIGQICRCGPLPIPDGPLPIPDGPLPLPIPDGPLPIPDTSMDTNVLTKKLVIQALSYKLKTASDMKLKEQCALALGYMAVGDPLYQDKQALLVSLFETKEEKAFDLQVTVGEAISCVAAGSVSTASHDQWKLDRSEEQTPVDTNIMKWTLETMLSQFCISPASLIRQASCVWLMCVLKHAGGHRELKGYLPAIQSVLVGMLGESNELTQEVASRSISILYELSGELEKQDLLKTLLDTLMDGRRPTNMSGDTELFQKGVLGKTPDGSHITTYKELCSLASDLNQPDLVYKFMHLANHHALWNSKKGAAFGFTSILANARAQLAPYLPFLIPRLYRYRFHPSPHIQLAMTSIWNALTPDIKVMDGYMEPILKDLMANLNSNEWQSRQASCLALGDLLSLVSTQDVTSSLPQLWELCLRARDDIKETVRVAADKACRSLDSVTVRALESSDKTGSVKVVEEVMPLLLTKGMSSPSPDIKAMSLATIVKISKNAGPVLKPHIASLVTTILEMLSSIESQSLNTLSLQLSGEREAQNKLDDIRIAATKSSALMDVVDLCIPLVDDVVVEQLVPKLSELLKSGTGLTTKVASAQFVITLVHNCPLSLGTSAGKLLGALMAGLQDRSSGVRKAYARAIGHLVKLVKQSSISKLHHKLKSWYLNAEDLDIKATVALVCKEMTSHSLDGIKRAEVEIIPLVFLGMHAKSQDPAFEGVESMWAETWNDLVIGKESAIRMYADELVGVSCLALESPFWPVKAQGAGAIATIADTMGPNLGRGYVNTLMTALLTGLSGRVWDGKEAVVHALRTVCISCQNTIKSCEDLKKLAADKVCHEFVQQCKKKPRSYQLCCIEATGDVLDALKMNIGSYIDFKDVLLPIVRDELADDPADVTSTLKLRAVAFRALGKAWPQCASDLQVACTGQVLAVMGDALLTSPWQTQVAILCGLRDLLQRLSVPFSDADKNYICIHMVPALCQCLGVAKYGVCRATLMVLAKLVAILKESQYCFLESASFKVLCQVLHSVNDPQDKELAAEILRYLQ